MTLGGVNYGHVGIIMEPTEYSTVSGGINFADPVNLGFYPASLAAATQQEPEPKQKQSIKSSLANTRLSKESI